MIEKWIGELSKLSDEDWSRYSFISEPLVNRISIEKRQEYHQKTKENARALACELQQEFGFISPKMLARKLNLRLVEKNAEDGGGFSLFASFEEPDTITVFTDNAEKTDQLIDEKELRNIVGNVKTIDLLIAHELYHYLELSRNDIYSAIERIKVWQIGPLKNISRIKCLGEIGAMAFAREYLQIPCSPYLFNVIMLYVQNPVSAERLYLSIIDLFKS